MEITVHKSDGRTYVVTADEALAGKNQRERQLTGHVKLKVSDGFELTTDRATHNQDDSIVRAPGAVAFSKGRMSGSGGNATYDQNQGLLTIAEQAKVNMSDETGQPTTDFTAGTRGPRSPAEHAHARRPGARASQPAGDRRRSRD